MKLDEQAIAEVLSTKRAELTALGVEVLLLAGSTARNENREDSDLDFVVCFNGPATFDRFMGLADLLEGVFGRPIDLTTKNSLRREIASRVLHEAKRVA